MSQYPVQTSSTALPYDGDRNRRVALGVASCLVVRYVGASDRDLAGSYRVRSGRVWLLSAVVEILDPFLRCASNLRRLKRRTRRERTRAPARARRGPATGLNGPTTRFESSTA